jgi:hypothetical protein
VAKKQAKPKVLVSPIRLWEGGYANVQYADHIIGVLRVADDSALVLRVKVERAEDGRGIYADPEPGTALSEPFDTPADAAKVLLADWLERQAA